MVFDQSQLIFSFNHARQKHTHLTKTLYLPLSRVAINLCRFIENRIMQPQCPNFWTKCTRTFSEIPISSFSRIHTIDPSWFNDSLIISYRVFQHLNLGYIVCLYVLHGFGWHKQWDASVNHYWVLTQYFLSHLVKHFWPTHSGHSELWPIYILT
jgi:hypothetical protein